MRGIKRIGLLTLGFILFGVTSCDDYTPKYSYNLEDNDLSKKIYSEYENEFSNSNYNNFLINCTKKTSDYQTSYEYLTFTIVLNNDGSFKEKIVIKDKVKTIYKYINDSWIKTDEIIYIDGKEKITFNISFNLDDGSFKNKFENTYDDKGNKLTKTEYEYINNEWIKTIEKKYINGKDCILYYVRKLDGSFKEKYESTYDDNGNKLTEVKYECFGNEWMLISKLEYTYDAEGNTLTEVEYKYNDNELYLKCEYTRNSNRQVLTKVSYSYNDNEFKAENKTEYTYDDNGNTLTRTEYEYINNEWISKTKEEFAYETINNKTSRTGYIVYRFLFGRWNKVDERVIINNIYLSTYYVTLDSNDLFKEKSEYTYDENGNTLTEIGSTYKNNEWVYDYKYEYTYEEGKNISIKYSYTNNEWTYTYKNETTYDSNGFILGYTIYKYSNGEWVIVKTHQN